MGLAALQLNKQDDAEYAFMRALQLNRNQVQASLALAELNLEKGNASRAREYYSSFLTTIGFYNIEQTASSLWVGIQLEQAAGNDDKAALYADILAENFPESTEYDLYQQSLGSTASR